MDKKIKDIQNLQKLIDHRTEVENQAIVLISQCRFDEAQELLATLDGCEEPKQDTRVEGKVTFYKLYRILTDCWARDFPVYASLSNLSASGIFDYSVHDSLLRWNMVFFTRGSGKVCFDFYFRPNGKGEVILSLEFFIFGAGIEDQYKDGGMNFFEESLLGYGISFPYYQEVFHGC